MHLGASQEYFTAIRWRRTKYPQSHLASARADEPGHGHDFAASQRKAHVFVLAFFGEIAYPEDEVTFWFDWMPLEGKEFSSDHKSYRFSLSGGCGRHGTHVPTIP